MRLYSLWNLRNFLQMKKSQLRVKQIYLLSIISNATNNKKRTQVKIYTFMFHVLSSDFSVSLRGFVADFVIQLL